MRLKGSVKGQGSIAYSLEELLVMHQNFEEIRIKKAQSLVGNRKMTPDPLCKFIVERTHFCPHKMSDANTNYWLETISLLDGEMGLTLPCDADQIPMVFFEALAIIRSARSQVRKEEKKE